MGRTVSFLEDSNVRIRWIVAVFSTMVAVVNSQGAPGAPNGPGAPGAPAGVPVVHISNGVHLDDNPEPIFDVNNSSCNQVYNMDGFRVCYMKWIYAQLGCTIPITPKPPTCHAPGPLSNNPEAWDVATITQHCINFINVKFSTMHYTANGRQYKEMLDQCVKKSGYEPGIGEIPNDISVPTGNETDSDNGGSGGSGGSAAASLIFANGAKVLWALIFIVNIEREYFDNGAKLI